MFFVDLFDFILIIENDIQYGFIFFDLWSNIKKYIIKFFRIIFENI